MEGLIFGGAYVQREICVSKSTGLALFLERNLPLFFVLLCATGQFPSTSPRGGGGAYIWRGDFTEGFLRYEFGGFIFGGAYTWMSLFLEFYGMQQQLVTSSLSEVETDSQSDVVLSFLIIKIANLTQSYSGVFQPLVNKPRRL